MPPDLPLPFYQPPTDRERLQHMMKLPHRLGLCGKAKPLNIGLFDADARNQFDIIDYLAKHKGCACPDCLRKAVSTP